MFDGMVVMLCAGVAIALDRWWKQESRFWTYFVWGMIFAFGSRDFIVGLAHWVNQ
jgi:hypothetical protein